MWHPSSQTEIKEKMSAIQIKRRISPIWLSLLGSFALTTVFYLLSVGESYFNCHTVKYKHKEEIDFLNASPSTLFVMFIGMAIGIYFLGAGRQRDTETAYICFDCQEPFEPAAICPKCGSHRISDIRLARWVEDSEEKNAGEGK